MLEGLEPSVALTGGPWYTDNELDTEFIQHLMDACYKFIYDMVSSEHLPMPGRRLIMPGGVELPKASRRSRRCSISYLQPTGISVGTEHPELASEGTPYGNRSERRARRILAERACSRR